MYWNKDSRDDRKYDGVHPYIFSEDRVGSPSYFLSSLLSRGEANVLEILPNILFRTANWINLLFSLTSPIIHTIIPIIPVGGSTF